MPFANKMENELCFVGLSATVFRFVSLFRWRLLARPPNNGEVYQLPLLFRFVIGLLAHFSLALCAENGKPSPTHLSVSILFASIRKRDDSSPTRAARVEQQRSQLFA